MCVCVHVRSSDDGVTLTGFDFKDKDIVNVRCFKPCVTSCVLTPSDTLITVRDDKNPVQIPLYLLFDENIDLHPGPGVPDFCLYPKNKNQSASR